MRRGLLATSLLIGLLSLVLARGAKPKKRRQCGDMDMDSPLTKHCFPPDGRSHGVCCTDIRLPGSNRFWTKLEALIARSSRGKSHAWCVCTEAICEMLQGTVSWRIDPSPRAAAEQTEPSAAPAGPGAHDDEDLRSPVNHCTCGEKHCLEPTGGKAAQPEERQAALFTPAPDADAAPHFDADDLMDGIASKNPFEGLDAAEDEDESSGSGEETAADQRARRAQVWGRRAGERPLLAGGVEKHRRRKSLWEQRKTPARAQGGRVDDARMEVDAAPAQARAAQTDGARAQRAEGAEGAEGARAKREGVQAEGRRAPSRGGGRIGGSPAAVRARAAGARAGLGFGGDAREEPRGRQVSSGRVGKGGKHKKAKGRRKGKGRR